MIRIRIEGTPDELQRATNVIRRSFEVLDESDPRPNRPPSKYARVYLDCAITDESVQIDAAGLATKIDQAIALLISDKSLRKKTTRQLEEMYPSISRNTWSTARQRVEGKQG